MYGEINFEKVSSYFFNINTGNVFVSTTTQARAITLVKTGEAKIISYISQSSTAQPSNSAIETPSTSDISKSSQNEYENVLNLLRDSIWQFIGSVLAVIAIIISVVIFILQKNKKLLSYEILSETALLSVAKEVEDKIQILFEGSAVKGVHLILLQISNTGNVPILPSDFLKDLTISFNGSTKILSAEITDKNPQSIDANLSISGTQLIISPSLWNSGDTITIKSLVSEFNESIQITGRIVGIKDIKLNSAGAISSSTVMVVSFGMLLIFVGLGLISFNQQPIFSALIAIGYILFFIPTFYDEKYRKFMYSVLRRAVANIAPWS